MILTFSGSFSEIRKWLTIQLSHAPVVHVGEWQGIRGELPQGATVEVEDVSFEMPIPGPDMDLLQRLVGPNLPWAEEHFQERVSGRPWNPPPSHVDWPFAQADNSDHRKGGGRFSHTYPERFWPRFAGLGESSYDGLEPHEGIRFEYGELADVVELLRLRPGSRQGFLPVWFPEDLTAARIGERVPCTLGYHFLIRNGRLKIVYYMRSCDFNRHFADDVYMAARLAQWVAEQLEGVTATKLVMHISSLHIFEVERGIIESEANRIVQENMLKVR